MGDLGVVNLDMVDMRVVDKGVIVAGVVELVVGVTGEAVSYTHLTLPTIYSV